MRHGWIVLIAALAVGCGKGPAAEAGSDEEKKPTVTVELATVKSEPVDDYASLQGVFGVSEGGLSKLAPAVAGRIGKVLVREGDHVRQGQVLVMLDSSVAGAQETSAREAANVANVQVKQSDTNLLSSRADQRSAVETARIGLMQARSEGASAVAQAKYTLLQSQADLHKLRAGARPQEIAQAHEATVQATAARDRAQSELDRDEALAADGYVSKRQLEDARTSLQTAASALAAAQDSEQLVRAGARPEEIRAAEAREASAEEAFATAQRAAGLQIHAAETAYSHAQQGILQVLAKEQDLAISKSTAAQKAADLAASSATLGMYRIVAPFDGVVVKRSAAQGDPADPATPVIFVQRTGAKTNFVASGLPDQISQIAPAMSAEITAGDKTYSGRVISVNPADPSGSMATVRISVPEVVQPGVFGTVHIVLRHHAGLPTVPDTAIVEKDGKEVVYKNVDGVATQTEVQVGSKSDGKTAILHGLKVGDSIVASGGNELDDGTKIEAAKADAGEAKDKD